MSPPPRSESAGRFSRAAPSLHRPARGRRRPLALGVAGFVLLAGALLVVVAYHAGLVFIGYSPLTARTGPPPGCPDLWSYWTGSGTATGLPSSFVTVRCSGPSRGAQSVIVAGLLAAGTAAWSVAGVSLRRHRHRTVNP